MRFASENDLRALGDQIFWNELIFLCAGAAVLALLAGAGLLLFRKVWVRPSPVRGVAARVGLAGLSLGLSLLLLDAGFYALFVESDGQVATLAGKRWFAEHWHPLNERGYRDAPLARLEGHRIVAVLGDSFAAGHGVDDVRERFSNRLEARLGGEWAVATLAQPGWDTRRQLGALRRFSHTPEVVVLSYLPNDVEQVAREHGFPFRLKQSDASPPWPLVTRHSYLWNYVALRLMRQRSSPQEVRAFVDYLHAAFSHPEIAAGHRRDLERLAALTRERGAELLVLLWPMHDPESSQLLTGQVARWMEGQGARVLDLALHFDGREARELAASPMDAHPSAEVHAEVAELLAASLCTLLAERDRAPAPGCEAVRGP